MTMAESHFDTNQSILEKNPLVTILMCVPLEVETLQGGVRPASVVEGKTSATVSDNAERAN